MRKTLLLMLLLAASTVAARTDIATRRGEFRHALDRTEHGPLKEYPALARPLLDHPLFPYLEYAHLRRQLDSIAPSQVERFLQRHADLPVAPVLRDAWLHALIARKDWPRYRAVYVERSDPTLRCAALQARLATGMDANFLDDAEAMWLSGTSVPTLCEPSFAALKAAGRITPALIWTRIDLAIEAGNSSLMRYLARGLTPPARARADSYADFTATPFLATSAGWPDDARSRQVITQALSKLAERDPDQAANLLAALAPRFALDAVQRGTLLNRIALWSAASYLPSATAHFANVPPAAFDERLHAWRVREALARADFAAARRAIAAMPETQHRETRWRYLDARFQEKLGDAAAARRVFAEIALEPNYFGFLAADRLDRPYALCPIEPDLGEREQVAQNPALQRALELHAIEREVWARREWNAAVAPMSAAQRRIAVALADDAGWRDRAASTLNAGDDMRLYALRFPLPHAGHLRREARRHGLDPSWVAALIRAESAWAADAHSHANARGLMQLLPATARAEARRLGIRYDGDASLFQPRINISLGTAHLSELLRLHGDRPYLATAAYNAGPTPVARWLSQRTPHDPDLWIETIPYQETREYVSRILAFSAIYDWRQDGKAVPVSQRMLGTDPRHVARRGFVCPTSTPVTSTP